jgi:hypothetical protein
MERNELNTQINIIITSIIFLKDEAIVMVGWHIRWTLLPKNRNRNTCNYKNYNVESYWDSVKELLMVDIIKTAITS